MKLAFEQWKRLAVEHVGAHWPTWCGAWIIQQQEIDRLICENMRLERRLNELEKNNGNQMALHHGSGNDGSDVRLDRRNGIPEGPSQDRLL
jgi:hypothetical protein